MTGLKRTPRSRGGFTLVELIVIPATLPDRALMKLASFTSVMALDFTCCTL